MARDPYSAAASGLETGFGLGLRLDQANLQRQQTAFENARQTAADQRAQQDLEVRQKREAAQEDRDKSLFGLKALGLAGAQFNQRKTELAQAAGATPMGQPIPQGIADEYADVSGQAAQVNQRMANIASRLSTGDITLDQVPPADRHQMILSTTGFAPEEAPQVMGAIKDFNSGMSTQNWGLVTQSMNILMKPKLQRSWGAPSAHGGTIDHTEVIGLDPSPNDPNTVIPRLRVYTSLEDRDGNKLYYDAPMTKNGTADPNDPVQTIDVKHGMDWLGNLGVAMQAVQNPQVAGMFTEGASANADRANNWRAELNARARQYQPKGITQERIRAIQDFREANMPDKSIAEVAQFMHTNGLLGTTGVGAATLDRSIAEIDAQIANGDVTPEEGAALKRQIATKTKPTTPLQQSQIELNRARAGTEKTKQVVNSARTKALTEGTASPTSAEDFSTLASVYLDTGKAPPLAIGKQGGAERQAFRAAVTAEAAKRGMTGPDVVANRAEVSALTRTQAELTKRTAAIELFSNKVEKDMTTFDSLLDKAGMDSPLLINKPINALRRQFSDPALAQLDLAAKQVGTEYERLITGGSLSVAQLHTGAQEDAKKLINGDMPPKQARAIMQTMRQEIANSKSAARDSLTDIGNQLRNRPGTQPAGNAPTGGAPAPASAARPAGGSPARIQSDADYNALPSGATFIAPDGSTRRKP